MRKALLIGSVVAAGLLALYAAAGWWLAPRLVHGLLIDQAASRGLQLQLDRVRTDPFALRVTLEGIALHGAGAGAAFATAHSARVDLAWQSLWRRMAIVQQAHVQALRIDATRWPKLADTHTNGGRALPLLVRHLSLDEGAVTVADPAWSLSALAGELHDLSTTATDGGRYELRAKLAGADVSSHGQLASTAAGWVLRDVAVAATRLEVAEVRLRDLTLHAAQIALPPREPLAIEGKAGLQPQGTLSVRGTVDLQPLHADLQAELDALPLRQLQRWLPRTSAMTIASGTLSARGRLRVAPGRQPVALYDGAATVRDLRLDQADSGQLLLAWQLASTETLSLQLPPALRIDQLDVQAPSGRLIIGQDGSVNLAGALGGSPGPDVGAAPGPDATATPARIGIARLRIEDGTLRFEDHSLPTPFGVTIVQLAGSVVGLSTDPGEPARLELAGQVQPRGQVHISGTIDLEKPTSRADINANFENLGLASLNPYLAKFAGYRIASGRISAQLTYEVRDGRLQGRNELVLRQIRLGEKLEDGGLIDVPLDLLVALLADSKGRIQLDIPVSGNLNDPKFDFGRIVAQAVGNAVRKVITAPFRALAGLLGGGAEAGELSQVRFDPGMAELAPREQEQIAQVARALEQRPQLGVEIHGGYDTERDLRALRVAAARQAIAQRAGVDAPDFDNPAVRVAAERLYLERLGGRPELQALRERAPRYDAALVDALAATVPIDAARVAQLAAARAGAVSAALIAHGADPARVRIGAARQRPATDRGVATRLALSADQPAAAVSIDAGPTRVNAGSADSASTVRQAQRALEAAGFRVGPVDGIQGSMTRSALRAFQDASGLPVTGRLDARTLSTLGVAPPPPGAIAAGDPATGPPNRSPRGGGS